MLAEFIIVVEHSPEFIISLVVKWKKKKTGEAKKKKETILMADFLSKHAAENSQFVQRGQRGLGEQKFSQFNFHFRQ